MRRLKEFVERSKVARGLITVANVVLPPVLLVLIAFWGYSYVEVVYVRGNIGHYYLSAKSGVGQLSLTVYDKRYPEAPFAPEPVLDGWHAGVAPLHPGVAQAIERDNGLFESDIGRRRSRPIFIRMPLSSIVVPVLLLFAGVRSVSSRFTVRSLLALLTFSALLFGTIASISR